MKCKISGEVTVIGLVAIPLIIIIIYSFLTILYTQYILKQENDNLADSMYSEQIKFSKQFDSILTFQVNMQVQNVYWNVYIHNQLLQKALAGQIKLNPNFKDILINVERTYNLTEDPVKLKIFKKSYLLVNSWFQRDKYFQKDLDPIQQEQMIVFSATDPLFRAILLERDNALQQNITRRFYIKNMYIGTEYDGSVLGPSANTTYKGITNPKSCPSGNIYDSRCRYWFNDTIHRKNISLYVSPPQLQYSNVGIPFLASVFCQRIELPPYTQLKEQYSTLNKQGSLYSVLCNNLDLTAAGVYFSSFNQKSAFKMLIDPSTQIAVYYSLFQLNSTQQQQTLSSLELNPRTTEEQALLFQKKLQSLYSNPILDVKENIDMLQINDDSYQSGFTFYRLNNPPDIQQNHTNNSYNTLQQSTPLNNQVSQQQQQKQQEEKQNNLKEHYVILNSIQTIQKLKDPWSGGYSINTAFILIDVLSKDMLSVQAQQMQQQINEYNYYSTIAITIFYVIIIILVILRFIRIFKLIISPINQLTNILKSVSLDDENQISYILGDKQLALESLFEQEIFLSQDTKILYESIVSLFKMVQFTQSNIFVQTESQTLLNLNQQIIHFQKFQNHRALGICHNNIGYIHFNAHRYQEALQEFSQAIIYSNYEVKIYEEDLEQSQLNNSNLIMSEVTRNIKLLSDYKNIINQIQKKSITEKEEKVVRKSAFSSGTSLLNNKNMQKIKHQTKKVEKVDKEQIIHYEVQSENSRSQLKLETHELQKQQNVLNGGNNTTKNKKLTIQESEAELNQENAQSQKLLNSQQLFSSHSLQKKKPNDKKNHKSQRNTKQISIQKDKSMSNSLQNKQEQNCDRKKNITESLSPSRSTTSKGVNQDNEVTNLFFCLYSRKLNYAKTLFMLLEKQNETLGNMWIELEQLLLEVIEIGNQMTLVNQIKSFQFSCYIYLISLAQKLNNQIKLAEYMRCSYEILQDVLNEQIQQDIYQEIRLNSNRTLKSEADNQTVISSEELLRNRDFISNYLQKLIIKTQLLNQRDINSTYLFDTQKMLHSQKISTFQSLNQHSQQPDQNQTVTQLLTQLIKNSCSINRNTSVSEYYKKQQGQNKQPSLNTIQNLQFSNISNINNNYEKSPLMQVLSPYRNSKSKSMFKKNESFNANSYKQVQINQSGLQKSQVYLKKRVSKVLNEKSPRQKHNTDNLQISQKFNIKNEEKSSSIFPKSLSNLLSKQKQITKHASNKVTNKLQKIKMHVREISCSNHDIYEKELKDTIQKIIKKKVRKQESKEITTGIYMPNLGSSSFCRNSNNYQQSDILIQKMVFIEAALLYQNQEYLETISLLTQQLENEYYYDPTSRHRFVLILYKIFNKLKIDIPEQLKQMISCYNKGIIYKVGLLSLCKSKKNRYKTYILTRQILSTILVKPSDQFSLLIYKNNMFQNLFQQISLEQINSIKDLIETQLMEIFVDDQQISPKQIVNEPQTGAPSLLSSNQQQNNQAQAFQNNQELTLKNGNLLAKKIRVQKTPILFKGQEEKQNEGYQFDANQFNNQSKENFNIQSFQIAQNDSSFANILQMNQTNFQQPLMNKIKGDNFSFQPTNNQNSLQESNINLQNQFQSTNNFQNNLNIMLVKNNSLISDSNLLQQNQQYFQSIINFSDFKKESLRGIDEIEELKISNKQQTYQLQQDKITNFEQNNQNISNHQQNIYSNKLKQDQNQYEFKHKQSQSSIQEQQSFGRINEFQSQTNSDSCESSDGDFANENIFALKNLEDDIQSEQNTLLQNTNDMLSIEEQLIIGVNRIILSHFYQDNYNLLHGKIQTEEQKLKQLNLKIQKNSEQFDIDCFNYLNIKKFIICVTDSLQIIKKTESYQEMIKLLYKLNTELLILQLNQQSHFEETNYPESDYFNNQLVLQIFYSEQKLLQYLYNNRHNQNYLYLPLTVEYFQTNFVFVFIF
ncbi:transmembrane protein, putative (macronuclear) [Tetrahymena thermophila SB210]|uniref:Transmembrane protein, putative n=1 Tax=Tetrahymena thermophila (strain SB210) TaxID=312017 RepID=Q23ZI0_TETTS|nr:transmembrane protein, putative [Tetrahymena thermophila SB210]EAS01877.2 transmembrane protein, putative [Tetrahymena thermophila SB210]|eukprot:XP_001022122.2 transmembrane protein, putative [Tetrahymena thermophila SB210]